VVGTTDDGRQATDDDDHQVDLIHPAIQIVKTVNPVSGEPGDVVTYTYEVTNTGDTTLYDVSVDDDVIGHIGDIPTLEAGATVVLTEDYVLPNDASAVINVGVATGEDELGEEVSDDDDASVTIVLVETPEPPEPPDTAFTGSDASMLATLAAGLLLMGLVATIAGRRRQADER
jgi:LPXTG-motif cell wall-anchored protein